MLRDWDINDSIVPAVCESELDDYQEWADGHCRFIYAANCDEAKKHTSGWAMRNTNNHNVNILKKSCLGVLVCSVGCTLPNGAQITLRPAICDKARRKQTGRPCPNRNCVGKLEIRTCRGHCGYPVTHFWRHTKFGVFFQAKGVHDHAKPEPKNCRETRRYLGLGKRKNLALLLTRDAALNKKLKTLNNKVDYNQNQVNYQQIIAPLQQNFSPEYQTHNMVHQQFSPNQQYSPNFNTNEFIKAEEIFQLDQPIKQFNSGMDQMYSKSPPTVLDLDRNYLVKNEVSVVGFHEGYERDDTMSLTSGSSASLFDDAYHYVDNNYLQSNYVAQEFNVNNNNFYGKSFYADDSTVYEIRSMNESTVDQNNYGKCEFTTVPPDQHQNYIGDYKSGGFNYGIYEEPSPYVPQFEQCAF